METVPGKNIKLKYFLMDKAGVSLSPQTLKIPGQETWGMHEDPIERGKLVSFPLHTLIGAWTGGEEGALTHTHSGASLID